MLELVGDIWNYADKGWVVVTTNGFVKSDGCCVMGRGIALQAAKRFPELPLKLGARIEGDGNRLFSFKEYGILTFPVKKVWWEPAKQHIIQRSCQELLMFLGDRDEQVLIPHAGCDNGRLNWKNQVLPIFEQEFGDDPRITIVDRRKG